MLVSEEVVDINIFDVLPNVNCSTKQSKFRLEETKVTL